MKNLFITGCLLLYITTPLGSQTKVTKKIADRSNNFGVTYFLPKTSLTIHVEVIKTTSKTGPYFRYAEKYLGVKNPVEEDRTSYELGKVSLTDRGVPDVDNAYIVEFKAGTTAPYVYLTEEGLICSINAEYDPLKESVRAALENPSTSESGSGESVATPVFFEELLMAGSVARQAEVAAKQIYRIHESRLNILTGEADNLPPDGESMKVVIQELDRQEKALTAMFTGSSVKETSYHTINLTPHKDMEREVLFRFSDLLGVVDADDLSGAPVYIQLKAVERTPAPAPVDPKEADKKGKITKGIIYNVPGKATVEILINRKSLYKGELLVAQFGGLENLAPVMFEDRKKPVKVYFYPETGAIKQIIQ